MPGGGPALWGVTRGLSVGGCGLCSVELGWKQCLGCREEVLGCRAGSHCPLPLGSPKTAAPPLGCRTELPAQSHYVASQGTPQFFISITKSVLFW